MHESGKSTNGLMKHIRDNHRIAISGSNDKKQLLRMGYFHGYKAYRFNKVVSDPFKLNTFQQIKDIYTFDNQLKSLLYSPIMQLETVLKNYTIATLVNGQNTDFEAIYKNQLTQYLDVRRTNQNQNRDGRLSKNAETKVQKKIKLRLDLKNSFDETIAHNYRSNVVQHYISQSDSLPLWAVFELITFGQFGMFLSCLNTRARLTLETYLGIADSSMDTNGDVIATHVIILKDLRNAIAHNHVVFDCRFKEAGFKKKVPQQLERRMHTPNITFSKIIDYLVLIIYYESGMKESKTDMRALVCRFKRLLLQFRKNINQNNFDKIMGTDVFVKIEALEEYIANQ